MGCLWKLITFPFRLAADIIGIVFDAVGRVLSLIIGLALVAAGGALCATVVGAVMGVPMILMGLGLLVRAIF